jgi:hypothetical protein
MKPIDFVVFDGDSEPNIPICKVAEAMQKDIVVLGPDGEYEILSYYMSNGHEGGCFFLEIQKKEMNK